MHTYVYLRVSSCLMPEHVFLVRLDCGPDQELQQGTIQSPALTSFDGIHLMINAMPATSYHTGTPKTLCFHRDSERSRKLSEVTQLSPEFGRVGRDLSVSQ